MVDAEMDAPKKGKHASSSGRSPAKDNNQNRPGAITPAKSTTMQGVFKPTGQVTNHNNTSRSNADDVLPQSNLFQSQVAQQQAVDVNIKDIIDLTASKNAMYRALAVYGK